MEHELQPEDWGGKTVMAPVSAHTKEGIDDLLEMILLVAEMESLKANPKRMAVGTVIESHLDPSLGPSISRWSQTFARSQFPEMNLAQHCIPGRRRRRAEMGRHLAARCERR